ncbi:hypothetical protein NHQ30_005124 [Ciborinia camelliae]|nr:hypothetical protein NHQ30_005124 [Ciborinia camelliae]
MSKSNSRRQSDFEIHEDSNSLGDMNEDKDVKKASGGENAISEEKYIGEALSQSQTPQSDAGERSDMEESEIGGDSILDQELSELQEDDSILEDAKRKHDEHDDCEDCKHAREEKRKRAEARELQMQKIEAEIKAAARKVVESIEKGDLERGRAADGHNDSILSMHTDDIYEPEDHDDSLLSAQTDESYERNPYNGQDGTELTYDTTKATLEDDGQLEEDEDSILHHDLSRSTDAETERGDEGGEYIQGGDGSSHYGDIEDDVFSNSSGNSPRFSLGSADEAPNRRMSNRNSWQSNRQLDLSKEAQQLIELNSPVVGEEASTESVISRIPSCASHTSAPRARDSSCSPRKVPRHPFRTPSDIRAMQMYSPAPSLFSTPHSVKRQQHPTVSRLGTPNGSQYSKSRTPTRFKKNREESPLVLLHVTVLPLQWQYSKAIVAPELPANLYNIREAYYLLQEKLSNTILTRGILLPHPQDSYECLEERFLDALELPVRPRAKILRCGHYIGPNTTSSDDDSADERDSGFGSTGRFKNRPDKVWCDICRRDVRYEDDDLDEDDKRFNIKIFASNGLMRAGAWAAAWREMERVDVEIEPFVQPWMVEDMEDLIERLREAEERGDDDSFVNYSDSDDDRRESLGSEAQRLHEEDMAKVTLRQKTADIESRNAREEWLAAASKAAEEEAERIARNAEELRLKEEFEAEALRVQEEEARLRVEAEAETSRLAEEAQNLADLEIDSSRANEDENETAKEIEAEAQRLHEEEMAADQALEEEAQRIHKAEVAEQKAIEEEAQRIYEAELAEQVALEVEVKKIMEEQEASRKAKKEESTKRKLDSAESTRLKDIYNQASTRTKDPSPSHPRTPSDDESLTELLVKAAGVAMRDRKNILILLLSMVVLFLALKPSRDIVLPPPPPPQYAPDIIIQNHRYEVAHPNVDQRGYGALRHAAAEGTLPRREIDSSVGWKGPEVVLTGSLDKPVDSRVVGSESRQDRRGLEIDKEDIFPITAMDERVEKIPKEGNLEREIRDGSGLAPGPRTGRKSEINMVEVEVEVEVEDISLI